MSLFLGFAGGVVAGGFLLAVCGEFFLLAVLLVGVKQIILADNRRLSPENKNRQLAPATKLHFATKSHFGRL